MKKTLALLACALLTSSVVLAQNSKTAHKPNAGVTKDSSLATTASPARPTNPNALPVGTAIKMKLETPINTAVTKPGDNFSGRVTQAVTLNGRTIIPVGSAITGIVLTSTDPRRYKGVSTINLHPQTVMLPDGTNYQMSAAVVDTAGPQLNVDEEGNVKGKSVTKGEKIEMAAGTGGGAVIGAVAGGGQGLLIGASIGAAVTVTHWLSKRHTAELPAGTEVIMELSRDMTVTPAQSREGN